MQRAPQAVDTTTVRMCSVLDIDLSGSDSSVYTSAMGFHGC
jgi:hypothetical protein